MTSKEIALNAVQEITHNCDTALGYGTWQHKAESAVCDAFHIARANRKMVTAVADEIVKCAFSMGQQYGDCMCMAVGSVLADWLRFKMLQGYEVKRAYKMLAE